MVLKFLRDLFFIFSIVFFLEKSHYWLSGFDNYSPWLKTQRTIGGLVVGSTYIITATLQIVLFSGWEKRWSSIISCQMQQRYGGPQLLYSRQTKPFYIYTTGIPYFILLIFFFTFHLEQFFSVIVATDVILHFCLT